ncbi:hypothetical protein [Parapedobacter soli]|uniref:hypothetical protein n=1 Tax=Parapedobacter soli TaxID=416955 RepID=UPI0021CA5CC2|nr:hypothetical protein [Parapedobacter soli]
MTQLQIQFPTTHIPQDYTHRPWVPKVGEYVEITANSLPGHRYTYRVRMRIDRVDGDMVTGTVKHPFTQDYYLNGTVINCSLEDITPQVYGLHCPDYEIIENA